MTVIREKKLFHTEHVHSAVDALGCAFEAIEEGIELTDSRPDVTGVVTIINTLTDVAYQITITQTTRQEALASAVSQGETSDAISGYIDDEPDDADDVVEVDCQCPECQSLYDILHPETENNGRVAVHLTKDQIAYLGNILGGRTARETDLLAQDGIALFDSEDNPSFEYTKTRPTDGVNAPVDMNFMHFGPEITNRLRGAYAAA